MKKVKPLPLTLTIISLLYFIYVVSNGSSRMIGDEVGGDPGGMLLPLVLSIFMFFGFLFITITERPSAEKSADKEEKRIFLITFISAILYVVLHKILGFVLSSSILLFILTDLYTSIGKEKISMKKHALAFVLSEVSIIAVYTLFRFATRTLLSLGRRHVIPQIFGNSNVTAFISCLIVALILVLACLLGYKRLKSDAAKRLMLDAMISYAVTLFLYIVFKQFFMVSMAPGIINW